MGKPRHTDTDPGWVKRRFAQLEKKIDQLAAAKRLPSASISSGGLTVKDGGTIKVLYPDGATAFVLGPWYEDSQLVGTQVVMYREDGELVDFSLGRVIAGVSSAFPAGFTQLQAGIDRVTFGIRDSFTVATDDGGAMLLDDSLGLLLAHPLGVMIDATTTASGANVYMDPVSGRIYRSTSSLRYKQDVVDADLDVDQVLALVPRRYRRKDEVEQRGDDAPTYVGFIAEEAAAAGLEQFVRSDADGPESFDYPTYAAVAHQAALREAFARIDALETELATLRGDNE